MLKDAPIIILDEATASIDAASDKLLLFFCFHRPASVPAFTKSFFLYPQPQYGPPEARVYCRTKSVTPPASLMV